MKKVLITGGTGQIGLGVAFAALELGLEVTLSARRKLSQLPDFQRDLIQKSGAKFHSIDLFDEASKASLESLASEHDTWINCAEPYSLLNPESKSLRSSMGMLYKTAFESGYTTDNEEGKKFIRIGSPPAEIPADGMMPGSIDDYPEDLGMPMHLFHSQALKTPYFKTKRILARLAKEFQTIYDLDISTAAPTGILGPWSNRHPDYEPMIKALKKEWPFNFLLPSVNTNVISIRTAARGILAVAEKGAPGEVYQLSGMNTNAAIPFEFALEYAGLSKPKLRTPVFAPGFTIRSTGFWGNIFKDKSGKPPWYLMADFYALMVSMGTRSCRKASSKLGYDPGGENDIQTAVEESVDWYRNMGML